ncbi:hypothetical protein PGT21_002280 [Puccinia graminis f. sp. tritici]|uniref:Uncharacterized protein n=1 Tax=Puccinia graminis f. sp. tritici TaxID=56615 RepID=A0A5B0PE14_PUCGR|nr:hypothetical protein PGT21_002280 [Puccinia graminis f. sp. tritici]
MKRSDFSIYLNERNSLQLDLQISILRSQFLDQEELERAAEMDSAKDFATMQ